MALFSSIGSMNQAFAASLVGIEMLEDGKSRSALRAGAATISQAAASSTLQLNQEGIRHSQILSSVF